MDLIEVAAELRKFGGDNLTQTLTRIEASIRGASTETCASILRKAGADSQVLAAAASLNRVAGQINAAIHAIGILLCLGHILEPGETIDYVSLGAGNTGRKFDLETNYRIAEFKFIRWRGGADFVIALAIETIGGGESAKVRNGFEVPYEDVWHGGSVSV